MSIDDPLIKGSYENSALIAELESLRIRDNDGEGAVNDLLAKEYESALKKAGFNPAHIYQIKDGRYKTKAPIQVCKRSRLEVLRALYAHYYGPRETMTLRDVYKLAIIEYGKLVEKGHREQNTLDHYIGAWNKYISRSSLPDMVMAKIRHKDLYEFYSDVTANGSITRSTLRNIKTTVSYCFDYALQNDIIELNVALSVRTDKLICAPESSHDAYTADEIRKLREVLEAEDDVYARIIRLDLCLVVRIGELEAMKWEDVDLERRTVRIHAQIVKRSRNGKGTFEYVQHTKAGKYGNTELGKRKLKLNSRAMDVLREQKRLNPSGEFVFLSKNGTPLLTNKVNDHIKRYCAQAGIRYLSSHSIRVSNITSLFDHGVAPTKIQVAAGHSDIRTTNGYCRSEICDEIDPEILEKAL